MRKCLRREYSTRSGLLKKTMSAVILTAALCILCLSAVQAEPAMEDVGENRTYREGSVKVHVYKDGGLSSSGDIKISRSAAPGWDEILDSSTEWNLSGGSSDLRLTESKAPTIKKGIWPEGYIISKDYTGRDFETEDGRHGYLFMGVEVKIPAGWRYSGKRVHAAAENTANYIGIEESAGKAAEKARWVKGRYHLNITAAGLRTARKIRYTGTEYDILLEPNECRINFDANGGSGDMAVLNVKYETSEKLPTCTYTRSGYTFKGWNTKKDGSGKSYAEDADVTKAFPEETSVKLYAQWKEIKLQGIKFTEGEIIGNVNTSKKAELVFIPMNALDKSVKFSSSNQKIVKVAGDGTMTFVRSGSATVTAYRIDGIKASVKVIVNPAYKDYAKRSRKYIKASTYSVKYKSGKVKVTTNYEYTKYKIYLKENGKKYKLMKEGKRLKDYLFKKLSSGKKYTAKVQLRVKEKWKTTTTSFYTNSEIELKAAPQSDGSVKLSWSKFKGATEYVIERAKKEETDDDEDDISYRKLKTITATKYTDKNVEPITNYCYRVYACKSETKYVTKKTRKGKKVKKKKRKVASPYSNIATAETKINPKAI